MRPLSGVLLGSTSLASLAGLDVAGVRLVAVDAQRDPARKSDIAFRASDGQALARLGRLAGSREIDGDDELVAFDFVRDVLHDDAPLAVWPLWVDD